MAEILAALKNAGLAEEDIPDQHDYSIQLRAAGRRAALDGRPGLRAASPAPAPVAPAPAAPPAAPAVPRARGPKAPQPPAPKPPPADLAPAAPPPPTHVYQVSNTVMVVIRNLDQVGAVLDAAVAAGAGQRLGRLVRPRQDRPAQAARARRRRSRTRGLAPGRSPGSRASRSAPSSRSARCVEHGPIYAPAPRSPPAGTPRTWARPCRPARSRSARR